MQFPIQDELSLRHSLGSKGAAGSVSCALCRNIYQGDVRAPDIAANGVKHYVNALPPDFELATDFSVWETVDHIASQHGRMSNASFALLEQSLGRQGWNIRRVFV